VGIADLAFPAKVIHPSESRPIVGQAEQALEQLARASSSRPLSANAVTSQNGQHVVGLRGRVSRDEAVVAEPGGDGVDVPVTRGSEAGQKLDHG
jgi:hypothetical protein